MRGSRTLASSVIALGVVGVIAANQLVTTPNALKATDSGVVQSSALYCTGLTNNAGGAPGFISVINTSDATRTVTANVFGLHTHNKVGSVPLTLAPHSSANFTPASHLKGSMFSVAAFVSGGGVVAQQVLRSDGNDGACTNGGVTQWYATGLTTRVGSSTILSLFNPTATAAVLNIAVYSTSGFAQPAAWQGITVAPLGMTTVNLGDQVINQHHFGVEVTVLRGALVINAVEDNHGQVAMVPGATAPVSRTVLPQVTTAEKTASTVVVTNPSNQSASVTIHLSLKGTTVPDQQLTVSPLSSAIFAVTPNSAIPSDGEATATITSSTPVVVGLVTGGGHGYDTTTMPTPWHSWVLHDATGQGFGSAVVTNTGTSTVTVSVTVTRNGNTGTWQSAVAPGMTVPLLAIATGFHTLRAATVTVTSDAATIVVGATQVTTPAGVDPVNVLNGR